MRRMIGRAAALAVAVLSLSSLFVNATSAASTGAIKGRVINESTGKPQAGVELTLTTGTGTGQSEIVEETLSDSQGRYAFEGLETGEDRFYALDARHEGGLFAGRPVTLPSDTKQQPVIESTLRVWNTTSDPAVVVIERDDMFVVPNEGDVGVIESVSILNTSNEAYIGRGAEMLGEEASGASFAFALPPGASEINIFDSTLDIPKIVAVDQGFAATVAFPPGENRTTFSYRLTGTGGSFDLSRPALYPTLEMSIYAAAPLEIRSNRLQPRDPVTLEGKTYSRWSADEPIEAGDPLQALAVAQGSVPFLPFALAGGALVMGLGLGAFLLRRRRKPSGEEPDRNRLLESVAELDLAFEAGDIDRARWDEQRSILMGRLKDLQKAGR